MFYFRIDENVCKVCWEHTFFGKVSMEIIDAVLLRARDEYHCVNCDVLFEPHWGNEKELKIIVS